jgi:molybdopterin synthase sulfur carrier subunit
VPVSLPAVYLYNILGLKEVNMVISVFFFGALADETGTGTKFYEEITTLEQLKLKVFDDFPEIIHYNFRISVNNEISEGDMLLNDGDEVAFLPPFEGG